MIEIDCRKCANCNLCEGCCELYGNDPNKAVKLCADNGFANYHASPDKEADDDANR